MIKLKTKVSRSLSGNILVILVLTILGCFMALPLVYAIIQAFKPMEEIFMFPPRFFVKRPTLDNFRDLFELTSNLWVPFSRYIFNSIFVTAIGTVGHVILASMAAYPLAKKEFPGKNIIFNIIVFSLLFAYEVTFIPRYILISKIGILNTLWAVILPSLAMPLGLYLMRQFMTTIPDALLEAAKLDGANDFHIFYRIIMPHVKPAWLTLIIFCFQSMWNQTGGSIIFDESLKLLPMVLSQISSAGIARAGVGSAVTLFLMIPPILTFVFTQSNILETMSHSGMKG